jgi:bifunctional non-homologous end joining protein LigD
MALEEYKRKRRFEETPEPPPKVEKKSRHRFVVQKHRATRLHYDFRLELEGVLKSWAVPKGPSLDPADKRLAMQVEDHPVSYFDFEGVIPEGNYGAGTVMVWEVGTWEPLSPVAVAGKYLPGTDAEALEMIKKGDLKFRLHGKKLNGDFALVRMRSRRPGSKGTEWLLIKKKDDKVVEGYDIESDDKSVLSKRSLAQIAGDHDAEWVSSRPASRGRVKAAWLADAIAKFDRQKKRATEDTESTAVKAKDKSHKNRSQSEKARSAESSASAASARTTSKKTKAPTLEIAANARKSANKSSTRAQVSSVPKVSRKAQRLSVTEPSAVQGLKGAFAAPMPKAIYPMLATPVDKPFDDDKWLFEIKWDGYRAVAFVNDGEVRLVSRNQNDLTRQYPELAEIPGGLKASSAVLDGEIVALDDEGRSSFSLMQQRTGFSPTGRRGTRNGAIPVLYYAFDLMYLDGYDLHRVELEARKQVLRDIVGGNDTVRYSDHHVGVGIALYEAARQKGLEGILAKYRTSLYTEKRSREWLKIKITQRLEAVIGGYTDPEGSRAHFGSIVLGLYNKKGDLIHVGQAGSGFDNKTLTQVWSQLKKLDTSHNPFAGKVQALRKVHFVEPKLVAEIKYGEWTHEGQLRAPVFMGLRTDKAPQECVFEEALSS